MPRLQGQLRRSLVSEVIYCFFFAAVVLPLLIAEASEAWFGERDQQARIDDFLGVEARLAATKIYEFINSTKDQMSWTVQLP